MRSILVRLTGGRLISQCGRHCSPSRRCLGAVRRRGATTRLGGGQHAVQHSRKMPLKLLRSRKVPSCGSWPVSRCRCGCGCGRSHICCRGRRRRAARPGRVQSLSSHNDVARVCRHVQGNAVGRHHAECPFARGALRGAGARRRLLPSQHLAQQPRDSGACRQELERESSPAAGSYNGHCRAVGSRVAPYAHRALAIARVVLSKRVFVKFFSIFDYAVALHRAQ